MYLCKCAYANTNITVDNDGKQAVKQRLKSLMSCCNDLVKYLHSGISAHVTFTFHSLQGPDTVGWVTGRTSGL